MPCRRPARSRFLFAVRAAGLLGLLSFCTPGVSIAVLARPGDEVVEPYPARAMAYLRAFRQHLAEPFDGYGRLEVLAPEFAVVALSNVAAGMYDALLGGVVSSARLRPDFDELAERATSTQVSPYGVALAEVRDLGDHNLYLSHLALILGLRRFAGGDAAYDALHTRVVRHLRERSLADPEGHARSYPEWYRFPADQCVTLLALELFDRIHGRSLAAEPLARFRAVMERSVHEPTGLPRSCLDDEYPGASLPRGCGLSFSILYAVHFAPDLAQRWYQRYRAQFFEQIGGVGGFRELPAGESLPMDGDSGPVLFGLGTAASGLGIGPARLFQDRAAYTAILRSAALVGSPRLLEPDLYSFSPRLGDAILFHGLGARPWFSAGASPGFDDSPGFPTLPALLLAVHAAAVVCFVRGLRRGRSKGEWRLGR